MANFNFNKVILGGRLTDTPELKTTASGISVASFSVAVNRRKTQDGNQQADFINCVAWRQQAELITRYFRKASCITIVGELHTRTWMDGNGARHYVTEVTVDEAYFVDSRGEQSQSLSAPHIKEEVTDDEDLPF